MVEKDVGARRGRKTLVSLIYISAAVYVRAYGPGGQKYTKHQGLDGND
jgi:hypothetical protein